MALREARGGEAAALGVVRRGRRVAELELAERAVGEEQVQHLLQNGLESGYKNGGKQNLLAERQVQQHSQ